MLDAAAHSFNLVRSVVEQGFTLLLASPVKSYAAIEKARELAGS